jgi:DNA-binding beta-propeller fold protein YncE
MGAVAPAVLTTTTQLVPSASGVPNSVAVMWPYEFVSEQGPGEIFTYDVSSGMQVQVGAPYQMPCKDPSGMVVGTLGSTHVMAVACYDTGSLVTLTLAGDGTLSALGSVSGLPAPYPGIALDGTNVFLPLFGQSQAANGAVAEISIAQPAAPAIVTVTPLASPFPGGFSNPAALTVAGGYVFVGSGSESAPLSQSSSVQVLSEAGLTLTGAPFMVDHSPQRLAVQSGVLYVTVFDSQELYIFDVSQPAKLALLNSFNLNTLQPLGCEAIPVVPVGRTLYVGCFVQGLIQSFDITSPAAPRLLQTLAGVSGAQGMAYADNYLLVTAGVTGGAVYQVPLTPTLGGSVGH